MRDISMFLAALVVLFVGFADAVTVPQAGWGNDAVTLAQVRERFTAMVGGALEQATAKQLSLAEEMLRYRETQSENRKTEADDDFCGGLACPEFVRNTNLTAKLYEVTQNPSVSVRDYGELKWITYTTNVYSVRSIIEEATSGFMALFEYINGQNDAGKEIDMTAPVIMELTMTQGFSLEGAIYKVKFFAAGDPPQPNDSRLSVETTEPGTFAVLGVREKLRGDRIFHMFKYLDRVIHMAHMKLEKPRYVAAGYSSPFSPDPYMEVLLPIEA